MTTTPAASAIPASPIQEQMWRNQALSEVAHFYTICDALHLSGPVDERKLRAALTALQRRHPPLRTSLSDQAGNLTQFVHDDCPLDLRVSDLSPAAAGRFAGELDRALAEPFQLDQPPLWRCLLGRTGGSTYLALVLHHIIADGWSVSQLLSELGALYQGTNLPPPRGDFPAVVAARLVALERREPELVAYWQQALAGAPATSAFGGPGHHSTHRGQRIRVPLPAGVAAAVPATAAANATTPYVVFLSALALQLARACRRTDIVLGIATANRTTEDELDVVGPFANQVPVRARFPARVSFQDAIAVTASALLDAIEHQELPFNRIVKAAGAGLDLALNPIFQVVAVSREWRDQELSFAGLPATRMEGYSGATRNYLTMSFPAGDADAWIGVEYDLGRFDRRYAERLGHQFQQLLGQLLADPAAEFDVLPSPRVPRPPPSEVVHERFLATAEEQPEAIAAAQGTSWCSYSELAQLSARIAAGLQAMGVRRGDVVAVALPTGVDLVTAELSILRAGAAFLPVDPAWPAERLRQILPDAGACLLVGAWPEERPATRPPLPIRSLAALAAGASRSPTPVPVEGRDLAYVIYTSGSTGRPKGVTVPHRSLCWVTDRDHLLRVGPEDRVAQLANVAFDAAIQEIWSTLVNGATLVLPTSPRLDPIGYAELLEGCTVGLVVSGLFGQLLQHPRSRAAIQRLQLVVVGGDTLDPSVLAWLERPDQVRLHLYGLTETPIVATVGSLDERCGDSGVPVGHALRGCRIQLLDERLHEVPVGVDGEIYVAGEYLAQGYLGQPALTARRFLPDPHRPGGRMLATGDRGRRLPSGALEFLGRADRQVKIRGFRVELAEVEAVLRQHPAVTVARAAIRSARGQQRLVAAVQPAAGADYSSLVEQLRDRLRHQLPAFMQPHDLLALPELPITANGKVDVDRLLSTPEPTAAGARSRAVPAERMRSLWSAVFGTEVGDGDDFFALGGDSIQALRLLTACRNEFGVDVSLHDLFSQPELRAFNQVVLERSEVDHG